MPKRKDQWFSVSLVLLVLLLLSWFILFKFSQENKHLRNSLPYLLHGDKISQFDLVDMNAGEINASVLEKGGVSVIFIFERPCSPCDKNVIFYKKIAEMLKDKVSFYGIVVNTATEAANFAEQAKLSFKVYIPKQPDSFTDTMRLKMNLAQVIVYTDKVEMIKVGQLGGEDVAQILNKVKGLI